MVERDRAIPETKQLYEDVGGQVQKKIDQLAKFTYESGQAGVNRFPHSNEMFQTQEFLIETANEHNINNYRDSFGNLYFYILPESTADISSIIVSGSHLDSVQNGGKFDGVTGCVLSFLTMILLDAERRGILEHF